MAPPKKITRQQREILLKFIEENREYARGLPSSPAASQIVKGKWVSISKKLNVVPGGIVKSPDLWRRYWIEWKFKTLRKASDCRRSISNNKLTPLNDLEIRVLEISGKIPTTKKELSLSDKEENDDDDSVQDQNDQVGLSNPICMSSFNICNSISPSATKPVFVSTTLLQGNIKQDNGDQSRDLQNGTPPPKWAIDLEERRITAEERTAEALESMTLLLQKQQERRTNIEQQIADALTSIASTVQHISVVMQSTMEHLKSTNSVNEDSALRKTEYLDNG